MTVAGVDNEQGAEAVRLRPGPAARRKDAVAILALLALGVGLPMVLGAIAGSLDVPRNDDWAYRRLALDFATTGKLQLSVTTIILGQVVVVQPLLMLSGLQPWAFTVAGVIFGSGAVLGVYVLGRQFLAPPRAFLAVALLLLFPGYLAYAVSFMSDAPAIALECFCLALGIKAVRHDPTHDVWLVAAVLVGCLALTFRDFALAAPAAVLVTAISKAPRRLRYWALVAACVGWYAALFYARTALRAEDLQPSVSVGSPLQSMQALTILAMVVLPSALLALAHLRRTWSRMDAVLGLELGLLLSGGLVIWLIQGAIGQVLLPNLASRWGAPQRVMFLGDRPLLFGDLSWAGITMVALGASVLLLAVLGGAAGALVRTVPRSRSAWQGRLASPAGSLAVFTFAVAAGLTVYGLFNTVYDRYYWPLVPALAIFLLCLPRSPTRDLVSRGRPVARAAAYGAASSIAFLTVLSLAFALNSNAFDAALWRGGTLLAEQGVPRDEIDAGLGWVGSYASTPLTGGGSGAVFYRAYWPGFHQCGFVTSRPEPTSDVELVDTVSYRLFLVAGPDEALLVYRETGPACQAR